MRRNGHKNRFIPLLPPVKTLSCIQRRRVGTFRVNPETVTLETWAMLSGAIVDFQVAGAAVGYAPNDQLFGFLFSLK